MGADDTSAEDLAQEVLLRRFQKPDSSQQLRHTLIDILRCSSGRSTSVNFLTRQALSRRMQPFESELGEASKIYHHPLSTLEFDFLLRLLPTRLRTVITLLYLWEFTCEEIGHAFGITTSRVSQLHTQAIDMLSKRLR